MAALCYIIKSMKKAKSYYCPWCQTPKSLQEMGHTPRSNGAPGRSAPYCLECRDGHPGMYYCMYHEAPHPLEEFSIKSGASIPPRYCKVAKRAKEQRASGRVATCMECNKTKPLCEIGGSSKMKRESPLCLECRSERPGESFCIDCAQWLPLTHFTVSQYGQRKGAKCRPCRNAANHGTTSRSIMKRQGSTRIECAACGYTGPNMRVDHDHSHCEGQWGCRECVRGYLCQRCNVAEGNIKSRDQLEGLIAYMEAHGLLD